MFFLVSVTLGMTKVKKKKKIQECLSLKVILNKQTKKSLFLAYVQMTSRTHKYKIELISNLIDD